MSELAQKAIREVIVRHENFVDWFTGVGEATLIDEIARAFAPTMVMIAPSGETIAHGPLVEELAAGRGQRPADFAIVIEHPHALWSAEDAVLIAYIERQTLGGKTTRRQSTALFTRDDRAETGVAWQHVHETFIGTREDE